MPTVSPSTKYSYVQDIYPLRSQNLFDHFGIPDRDNGEYPILHSTRSHRLQLFFLLSYINKIVIDKKNVIIHNSNKVIDQQINFEKNM